MSQLTTTERQYVALRKRCIVAVSSVHGYITSGEGQALDQLEAQLGEARAEQLKELAYNQYLREA